MRRMLLGLSATFLFCVGTGQAATPPAPAASGPSFEVRLVVPCQEGDKAYVVSGGNEEFCLAKEAVFDATGVVKVERYPVLPKAVMRITDAASERLFAASSLEANERVGFVFNGRLIFVPYISEPVKTKDLEITLKNAPEEIDALVAAFPGSVAAKQ